MSIRTCLFPLLVLLAPAVFLSAEAAESSGASGSTVQIYQAQVERVYPRPMVEFTQGLVYSKGRLYESVGLYGKSAVTVYDFDEYTPISRKTLADRYFGEGLAIAGDSLIQLTWRESTGFVYDPGTLEQRRQFKFEGEGWGLTYDGTDLIMSDGSDVLYFRDTSSFNIKREVAVRRLGRPLRYLNELEYIDGYVYANVWRTEKIVMISPNSGRVVGEIDVSPIVDDHYRNNGKAVGVLNGIAWDKENERLFITGKHWPHLFHISLQPMGVPD